MEWNKIEILLEKYFEGETSSMDEKELQNYFSSPNVAQHLEQYKPLFDYFSIAATQKFAPEIPLQSKKRKVAWLSIAASVVIMLGVSTYMYFDNKVANQDLGTYTNPEVALKETQKALAMLSTHVNTGIVSVNYIQEYEDSKQLIFKQ
ncbi:hypothetical protein AB3G33_08155 [Flavobacterium sp. WC2421]|jgi:hypothetical protein|uniref:Anti-sigma factor n=3 Tax=unclassified Flavobacterium TaxID=196869 RepID=A0AB39WAM9_9FLAO